MTNRKICSSGPSFVKARDAKRRSLGQIFFYLIFKPMIDFYNLTQTGTCCMYNLFGVLEAVTPGFCQSYIIMVYPSLLCELILK